MNRLKDKWNSEKRYYLPILGEDKDFIEIFEKRQKKYAKENKNEKNKDFYWYSLEHSVEIILTKDKEKGYILNPIIQCLDTVTFELVEGSMYEIFGFENDDELKRSISFAMMKEVPVYGNNQRLQKQVDKFQEDIIINGIIFEDKKYTLTTYKNYVTSDHNKILKRINQSSYITKAEINLLNNSFSSKFREYTNAANFLSGIDALIDEFSNILQSKTRNENKLQNYITTNPIILGTKYKTIIPKHKLGSEFEMDYALQRFDDVFDLVELESSNLPLFNKNGQPSHYLVHAEQQILDWQDWLEEKNFYAREQLENINSPMGIIVIGTNNNTDLKKLRRRNIAFSNNLKIYTYDQLLSKLTTLNETIKRGN